MGPDLEHLGLITLLLFSTHSLQAFPDTSINEIPETQPRARPSSRVWGPLIKSPQDKRDYRALILDNGMRVVLISDRNATKAAVSMNIGVGSMNDPPHLMGLTHFNEHMLFLGSKKFPVENALQKWILDNGGNVNAMTLPDHTTYFFTLSPSALRHSLEQLSEMLISPLFTDSALEREIQAVESEHLKYRSRERRRIERVEAQTGRPGHPFCMYRTGTMETLQTSTNTSSLRAALLDHHLQYHSANLMGLTLFGTEDLDSLQSMVEEIFLAVPNRNVSLPVWPENPYGENELGERVDIVPLGNLRSMQLIFPLPYSVELYKSSPVNYVSYLLGLEGTGSLAFFLKRKGWVDALQTGVYRPARGFSFFKIEIKLTHEGLANLDNVTCHVFEYIQTMKEAGPQKWFWEEIRAIGLINVQYREELHPLDLTYPLEKVLIAENVDETEGFNANEITQTFSFLRPSNLRIIVTAPEFKNQTQYIEEMYGVNYNRTKIHPSTLQSWSECNEENPDLHLPRKNEFIASDFSLRPRDNLSLNDPKSPRKVMDSNLSHVWYLQDTTFLLPKAIVTVSLLSPLTDLDPLRSNLLQVWVNILDDLMMEFKYTAAIAGLESNIQTTERGLQIHVRGFNDKLPHFLFKICQSLSNTSFTESHFQAAKETLAQAFANGAHVSALEKANELHRLLMFAKGWSRLQGMELMEDVSLTRVKSFVQEFLSRLRFVWVFYGNLSPEEASRTALDCQEIIVNKGGTKPLFDEEVEIMRIVEVPEGSNLLITKNEENIPTFSTIVAFQVGLYSPKRSVLTQLLQKISYLPFFDQLRTREQLGYTTGTDTKSDKYQNILTFRLFVEGNKHPPSYVETRIETFLLQFEGKIRNITVEEFRKHQKSLSTAKAVPPKTLEEKMNFLLREITNERYFFNQMEVELQVLDSLGLKDLQDFFHEVLVDRTKRRRISIQVASPSSQDLLGPDDDGFVETAIERSFQNGSSTNQLVTDIDKWKRRMRLFPSLGEVLAY